LSMTAVVSHKTPGLLLWQLCDSLEIN
jgi:hypothetical protein